MLEVFCFPIQSFHNGAVDTLLRLAIGMLADFNSGRFGLRRMARHGFTLSRLRAEEPK
jgi:hypothetical protein